MKDTIIHALL